LTANIAVSRTTKIAFERTIDLIFCIISDNRVVYALFDALMRLVVANS